MIKKEDMQPIQRPSSRNVKIETTIGLEPHIDPNPPHMLPKIDPLKNPKRPEPVITETPEFSYSSPMVDDELKIAENLKNNQLNMMTHAIQHMGGLKTRGIYFNQVKPRINNDFNTVTSPNHVNDARYNRIDNMIVITDSELSQSFSVSEVGTENEISTSAIIFPGTITPIPSDLFYVYDKPNQGTLYLISEVEPIYDIDHSGWKIQLKKHYDQITPEELNLKVDNFYTFVFDNVGTNLNPIIERSVYIVNEAVSKLYSELCGEFLDRFFDVQRNIIRLEYSKEVPMDKLTELKRTMPMLSVSDFTENTATVKMQIMDIYMMEFFKREFKNNHLEYKRYSVIPVCPIYLDDDFKSKYKKSIYTAFVKRDKDLLKYPHMLPIYFKHRTLRDIQYNGWHYFEPIDVKSEDIIDIYPPNLITRLIGNLKYDKNTDSADLTKYNIFFDFFNNKNWYPKIQDLKPFIDKISLMDDVELYGIGPLLMYMCISLKNSLNRKIY